MGLHRLGGGLWHRGVPHLRTGESGVPMGLGAAPGISNAGAPWRWGWRLCNTARKHHCIPGGLSPSHSGGGGRQCGFAPIALGVLGRGCGWGGGRRSGHRWETGEGGREPVAAGGFQHRGGAGPPWGLCGSGESRLRCGEQWVPGGCGCVAGGESSPEPGFKAVPAAEPQGSLPCPAAIRPGAACPPGCVPPPQQRMGSWVPCSCAVG